MDDLEQTIADLVERKREALPLRSRTTHIVPTGTMCH
jgi:hypothetical protein